MEVSQTLLGWMCVWALAVGAVWGVIYDLLRLPRVALGMTGEPPCGRRWSRLWRSTLLFCEDVLFGVIGGVLLILLLYYTNDGQLRGLAVLSMLVGFFVYEHTVGRLVRFLLDGLLTVLGRLIRWVMRCLGVPCRFFYRLYRRTVGRRLDAVKERCRMKKAASQPTELHNQDEKEPCEG